MNSFGKLVLCVALTKQVNSVGRTYPIFLFCYSGVCPGSAWFLHQQNAVSVEAEFQCCWSASAGSNPLGGVEFVFCSDPDQSICLVSFFYVQI